MAFCPKCNEEIGVSETLCPHCGYDFPATPQAPQRGGFLYTPLAELALVIGQLAAGVAGLGILVVIVRALRAKEWTTALVECPLAFLVLLGVFVAFGRVRNSEM